MVPYGGPILGGLLYTIKYHQLGESKGKHVFILCPTNQMMVCGALDEKGQTWARKLEVAYASEH